MQWHEDETGQLKAQCLGGREGKAASATYPVDGAGTALQMLMGHFSSQLFIPLTPSFGLSLDSTMAEQNSREPIPPSGI